MNGFWEVAAAVVGGLVLLQSALDAIRGITLAPVRFFRWLRRAVRAVDVITSIPKRLDTLEDNWAAHIKVADRKTALLDGIARDLGVVIPKVEEIHYQVNNNGGGSAKDAIDETLTIARDVKASLVPSTPTRKRGSSPA